MKTRKFYLAVVVLLIMSFVSSVKTTGAEAQSPPPPPIQYVDEIAGNRAAEIAVVTTLGDCASLPTPGFVGMRRNLTLNEDTTAIVAYYDGQLKAVCVLVWGTWPGTVDGQGVSEFDSRIRILVGNGVVYEEDKPLIRSNPAVNGVPSHFYMWKVPCGGNTEFIVLVDYFQQQILGNDRWGMPHRDWSGSFRNEICRIFLPIIRKEPPPPPPSLTCQGWTTDIQDFDGVVITNFNFEIEPGWAETLKTLLLYPGEVGNLRIFFNRQWNGYDLSGQLREIEVIFNRQDGTKFHNISFRFDNLDGPLYASDMDNEIYDWWWLTVRLHIADNLGQNIWCQQRIAGIDPIIAEQARQYLAQNPGISWEEAIAAIIVK